LIFSCFTGKINITGSWPGGFSLFLPYPGCTNYVTEEAKQFTKENKGSLSGRKIEKERHEISARFVRWSVAEADLCEFKSGSVAADWDYSIGIGN